MRNALNPDSDLQVRSYLCSLLGQVAQQRRDGHAQAVVQNGQREDRGGGWSGLRFGD